VHVFGLHLNGHYRKTPRLDPGGQSQIRMEVRLLRDEAIMLHLCDPFKSHQLTGKASLRSVKYPLNSSAILPSVSATIVQINE
jgi:hypothetical protein